MNLVKNMKIITKTTQKEHKSVKNKNLIKFNVKKIRKKNFTLRHAMWYYNHVTMKLIRQI